MKIVRMNTSSFWKGEAGVKGLVEDQGETFEVNLYLGSGRVRDYSCSCSKGNSYRGMCAHGEALFAYYNQQREEASKPTVHTSSQVHTMIREYTNREVALILAEEVDAQVRLEPVLILDGKDTRLEFEVGITRFYAVRDLRAFKRPLKMVPMWPMERTCPFITTNRLLQTAAGNCWPCLWEGFKTRKRSAA